MRPTLLRVLTDLYVQKLTHTPDEERHYTELALRLLDAVDVPTRVAVAERLCAASRRRRCGFCNGLPATCRTSPPLRAHPLLQPSAPAAARQAAAPAPIVERTALASDEQPADRPAVIDPTTAQTLNELFFAANADERRLILLNLEVVAAASRRA